MSENELIPLLTAAIGAESLPTCNARDLHAALKAGRDFSTWIKGRIEEYGFVEGEDYSPVLVSIPKRRGQPRIDYHLTLDMAKEIAMLENNAIGRRVRRYFIQAEKELRQRIIAELEEKAEHVLPIQGVKLIRDSLSDRTAMMLHQQSNKVLQMIMKAPTRAERQNLHYHFRQINLTLGVPTIDLEQIEAEIVGGHPALEG